MAENRPPDEDMVQRCIDLETGEDITGRYIAQRLKELEQLADKIIARAEAEYKHNPEKKDRIFVRHFDEIYEKLGQGSIGPATAAAGPLMQDKQERLAEKLDFDLTGFLFGAHEIPPEPPKGPQALTTDEINKLLRATGDTGSARVRLKKRFQESGNEFNEKIIYDLISDELNERENSGEASGLWIGGDSGYSLSKLINYKIDFLPDSKSKITATCDMSYLSSHMVAEEGVDLPDYGRTAIIRITINQDFESTFFSFAWA